MNEWNPFPCKLLWNWQRIGLLCVHAFKQQLVFYWKLEVDKGELQFPVALMYTRRNASSCSGPKLSAGEPSFRVTLQLTVSQPLCLGVKPILGLGLLTVPNWRGQTRELNPLSIIPDRSHTRDAKCPGILLESHLPIYHLRLTASSLLYPLHTTFRLNITKSCAKFANLFNKDSLGKEMKAAKSKRKKYWQKTLAFLLLP
jgi:hypothetical protein